MTIGKCLTPATMAAALACTGCAVPKFDVKYDRESGRPTVSSIIERIECELTDTVRDPLPRGPGSDSSNAVSGIERFLLNGDYDVQVSLQLEVNDTGGLTPSITFMEPVDKLISFMFGGSATLSESRDHTYTDNFQLSMRKLYADAQLARQPPVAVDPQDRTKFSRKFSHTCPPRDSNLSGTLGIGDFIAMGSQTDRLPPESATQAAPTPPKPGQPQSAPATNATQAFGGTISFIVTKNINGVGPTWTTTRWKGPGGLLGLSRVNTDKITLAFSQGPHVGQKALLTLEGTPLDLIEANGPNLGAYNFLQQQITQSINSQLQFLVNQPH